MEVSKPIHLLQRLSLMERPSQGSDAGENRPSAFSDMAVAPDSVLLPGMITSAAFENFDRRAGRCWSFATFWVQQRLIGTIRAGLGTAFLTRGSRSAIALLWQARTMHSLHRASAVYDTCITHIYWP